MKVHNLCFSKLKKLNYNGITEKNVELSKFTTFRIGGKARIFLKIHTLENFIKVMEYLKTINLPIFILGNGSNVLVSSKGFDGIIIKLSGDFSQIVEFGDDVEMGAGVLLSEAYNFCKVRSYSGFEDSIGIPATIGGATAMNASCYDFEMSKLVDYVVAYDFDKIVFLNNSECEFDYRKSIFQSGKYIILRVGFKLNKKPLEEIELSRKNALNKRLETQPKGFSAGCVFKRLPNLCVSKMLDEMGAKNMCCGDAIVSDKHANFIINQGNATSSDVHNLIKQLQDKFYKTYNEKLETEIKFLGEFE